MKVFAHRGASGEFPENTLLAFEQAIAQQADGIEFDVQYHDSGAFVLLHDTYLDKTTNGQGSINDYTLAELQQLDAGKGEKIPTLQEALVQINGRCSVNIELKSPYTDLATMQMIEQALIAVMHEAVEHYHFTWSNFVVSSFNHLLLQQIKTAIPYLAIGVLFAACPINYAACATELNAYSAHPCIDMLNEAFVNDAHARGLKVWVYTVDKTNDINICKKLRVDGIFTNFPIKSKAHLIQIS